MSVDWAGMVVGHGWWGSPSTSGKSAVQLLQESKSRYVKSDRVLVSKQQPSRPDHLQINANPNIFLSAPSHTLHVSRPSPAPERRGVGDTKDEEQAICFIAEPASLPPPIPPRTIQPLTSVALAIHTGQTTVSIPPPLPARTSRTGLRPRAKTQPVGDVITRGGDLRRSVSHGPADKREDVQMKLRKLLVADSRESLFVQGVSMATQATCSGKRERCRGSLRSLQKSPLKKVSAGTFRAEVAEVTQKSLQDLPGASLSGDTESDPEHGTNGSCRRRPSCPGAIFVSNVERPNNTPPQPPPRPPRLFRDSPPTAPVRPKAKPPPRPPPPTKAYPGHSLVSPIVASLASNAVVSAHLDGRRSSESEASISADEHRRRPILRSKSDVTHERFGSSGHMSNGNCGPLWGEEEFSRRSSYCSLELEEFFDSLGLDSETRNEVLNSPSVTPPIYFEEVSSDESDRGVRRGSSDSDEARFPPLSLGGRLHAGAAPFQTRLSEPSIIEKNARVIKWLFKCQKAMVVPPQRFGSNS